MREGCRAEALKGEGGPSTAYPRATLPYPTILV
jgi:hypothetical protein